MNNSSQVRTVQAAQTSFLLREHPDGATGSTPVLLLHGVPETASCWKQVAPHLADGRRVLAPDLPGLGGSSYPGPFDIASLVSQLAALVETEVPGGRVDVVGHDWGGSLALALAGARPELVRRLVVVNAPYRQVPLLRAAYIPFLALPVAPELLFKLGGRRVVDAVFATIWKSSSSLDEESRAEYWAAYTDPVKIAAMLGYYRAATRPRLVRLVLRDGVPVPKQRRVQAEKALVLWGAADPILPVSLGEGVVRDLGADCVMVTVPGAGHFVIEEAPEVVTRVLLDFLADEATGATPAGAPAAPPEKAAKEHEPIEPPPGAVDRPAKPAKRAPARKAARPSATAVPSDATSTTSAATAAAPPPAASPPAASPPAAQKPPSRKPAVRKAAPARAPKAAKAAAPVTADTAEPAAPAAKARGTKTAPPKAPAVKSPAVKAPAVKAPAGQAPAGKAPAGKTAAVKAPAAPKKTSAAKLPARKAAVRKPPSTQAPAAQAPAAEPPVSGGPLKRASARSVPANNPPGKKKAAVIRARRNQP